ncbi:MAG: glycosyltransferase [Ignavibacteriaceae bacterium]|nr:glycosyltransferase [Ignavibacteriaceae bacterium]
MKISVITPTNNSEKTILNNVESVTNQTYHNFEHIIIDNLSTDNTLNLIRKEYEQKQLSSNLKVISEKDAGISDAFNKGIAMASGGVIGILNSDDYFYNNLVFEKVVKEFNSNEILFVHGNIFFEDKIYGSNVRKPLLCPIQTAMPYNHPTMFFRKDVYKKYGMFDTSYKYAMDFEFICRLEKQISNFRQRGIYIEGEPLSVMNAGGESWQNEIPGIKEVKRSLIQHGLWNHNARVEYSKRMVRTKFKRILNILNLNMIIKFWRKHKWR